MDNAVMIGTKHDDIVVVVVQGTSERIDMMSLDDLSAILLCNKLPTDLAAETVEDFQVVANGTIKFSHLDQPWQEDNASVLIVFEQILKLLIRDVLS